MLFFLYFFLGKLTMLGITEVKGAEARHGGIQVNDAQGGTGGVAEHDIVQLGIIVGDPQRKRSSRQHIHQRTGLLLSCQGKVDLGPHIFGAAADIGCQCLFENAVTVSGVVEIGNDLTQGIRRKIF